MQQDAVRRSWIRIAKDLRATTGPSLTARHEPGVDDLSDFEINLDGERVALGQHVFSSSGEEDLQVELVGFLRESFLDEEVSGGWPIYSDQLGHPLDPTMTPIHVAAWWCPSGRASLTAATGCHP